VSGTTVTVPIDVAATDATAPAANLRAYETVVGAGPDWSAATRVDVAPIEPVQLDVGGLAVGATNTVWVRAVDWAGNTGPASSLQVVQDSTAPPEPTITSPRTVVPDTTATVTFTGSDADPTFLRYEACTSTVAAAAACPGAAACAFAPVAQSYPVLLAANQRTCLWARAVDKAGRTSSVAATTIMSDVSAPTAPVFRPSYDPAAVTVRAEWVDLFLATAPTDAAWGGAWKGIGWIEVDGGGGFQALCTAAACHPNDAYNPCTADCGCTDARVRCDGTTFTGLRVPLATASHNWIAVRSVDLAGTASNGLSQEVATETTAGVIAATSSSEFLPSLAGNLVSYTRSGVGQVLVDLGANRRFDSTDTTCTVAGGSNGVLGSKSLLAYLASGELKLRRSATGAAFCGVDTTTSTGIYPPMYLLGASGERVAYVGGSSGAWTVLVREPGANGVLGDPDDATTSLGTFSGYVWDVQLAGSYVRAMVAGTATGGQMVERVLSSSASFASGFTIFDLPYSSVSLAALSPDGSKLAYTDTSLGKVVVRFPTAGRYGAGDVTVTKPLPQGFVGTNTASIAIEGNHLVVADAGIGALLHWDAGPDGKFGTADDLYGQLKPSKVRRRYAALSAGLFVYEEGNDVFALDLTNVRWEDVPSGYDTSGALVTAASGSVFFGGSNPFGGGMPLVARCATGRDSGPGTTPNWFSAGGDYVVYDGGGLWLGTRDTTGAAPSGCFFTGSSTAQLIFSSYFPMHSVVLGETVLAANRPWGTPTTTVTAIEPAVGGPAAHGRTGRGDARDRHRLSVRPRPHRSTGGLLLRERELRGRVPGVREREGRRHPLPPRGRARRGRAPPPAGRPRRRDRDPGPVPQGVRTARRPRRVAGVVAPRGRRTGWRPRHRRRHRGGPRVPAPRRVAVRHRRKLGRVRHRRIPGRRPDLPLQRGRADPAAAHVPHLDEEERRGGSERPRLVGGRRPRDDLVALGPNAVAARARRGHRHVGGFAVISTFSSRVCPLPACAISETCSHPQTPWPTWT